MLRGRNRYSVVPLLPLFFQTAEDPFGTVVILKYALKPIRGKLRILFNLRHGDYQKKEDFKRDLQDRLFDIDKIRRTNEEEIRLREERERSFERRSVYPRPTPYAARPVVPAGPTQEELDAEYIRICQSYDPTSDEWTVDRYNRRWIMCTVCGRIKQDAQMSYYGGKGGANRGVCADCSRNGRS